MDWCVYWCYNREISCVWQVETSADNSETHPPSTPPPPPPIIMVWVATLLFRPQMRLKWISSKLNIPSLGLSSRPIIIYWLFYNIIQELKHYSCGQKMRKLNMIAMIDIFGGVLLCQAVLAYSYHVSCNGWISSIDHQTDSISQAAQNGTISDDWSKHF